MRVIFTDLDGTLLDPRTYSWVEAQPALELLKRSNIPLVVTTSKTRAEVEMCRRQIGNRDPFIVENGGAIFIPEGYFPFDVRSSVSRGGYQVIEFGACYDELVETLQAAAIDSGTKVAGFHELSSEEVSVRCGLPLEQAKLAKMREYDEPFEILDGKDPASLALAIQNRQRRYTRGGRFHHITGSNDKAAAVILLTNLYRAAYSQVLTIGLGDGWNDVGFLNAVNVPLLVPSPEVDDLQGAIRDVRVTKQSGPAGWNETVTNVLCD